MGRDIHEAKRESKAPIRNAGKSRRRFNFRQDNDNYLLGE